MGQIMSAVSTIGLEDSSGPSGDNTRSLPDLGVSVQPGGVVERQG